MRLLNNGIALHVFNAFVLLLVLETAAAMLPSSRALDLKFHDEFRLCLRTLMIPHDKLAVHLKLTRQGFCGDGEELHARRSTQLRNLPVAVS